MSPAQPAWQAPRSAHGRGRCPAPANTFHRGHRRIHFVFPVQIFPGSGRGIWEISRRASLARTRSKRVRLAGVLWRFPGSSLHAPMMLCTSSALWEAADRAWWTIPPTAILALHRAVVDELGDRLHLPSLAFRFIGSFYHVPVQRGIVRLGGVILLQQFREPLCRSFLRLLQLFQRIQRVLSSRQADASVRLIHRTPQTQIPLPLHRLGARCPSQTSLSVGYSSLCVMCSRIGALNLRAAEESTVSSLCRGIKGIKRLEYIL